MGTMHAYEPTFYNRLHDISEANGYLDSKQSAIADLGKIIRSHELHNDLGICLLHKHYNIRRGEKVIQKISHNRAYTAPDDKPTDGLIPYMWKYVDSPVPGYYPLEFIDASQNRDVLLSQLNRITSRKGFLTEMAQTLKDRDLFDTFGLISIGLGQIIVHDEDQIITETTNTMTRISTLVYSSRNESLSDGDITTVWTFASQGPEAERQCGHCRVCKKCASD